MSKLLRGSTYSILALAIAGCVPEPPPFNPREFTAPEMDAAVEVVPHQRQPLPTTVPNRTNGQAPVETPATGPILGIEPVVRLSLQEIVQRAIVNSPDIAVESYNPAIEETRTVQEEARFDPSFISRISYEKREQTTINTSTSPLFGGGVPIETETDSVNGRVGLRQLLPFGGQVELRYDSTYTDNRAFDVTPDPAWDNELVLQITQPLLREFGTGINRARITVQRNNQQISVLDFRQRMEEVLFNIEQTYWQLVAAQRNVRIAEDLLSATIGTADLLSRRIGLDVTRQQISQANSTVQLRQRLLIGLRAETRNLSDQLKRLMGDPEFPVTSPILLLPATDPLLEPVTFDLNEQIETALLHRAELGQQALRIENTRTLVDVAGNALLPSLNLLGSVGVQGLDDSFGDALDEQSDFNNISYGVGLELEIPIGNRAARATYKRALLQRMQANANYLLLTKQVALDVKQALREIDTQWESIVAARAEVFASQDALQALEQREKANEPLTPDFVDRKLQAQAAVAIAEQAEAQAISAYNLAIARLERAKGTLLRYNNVVMEEAARQIPTPQ